MHINKIKLELRMSEHYTPEGWAVDKLVFKTLLECRFCIHNDATVTLTFDIVTSKCIGVVYWPWPIFLPSTMTVTQKLFKIF